MVELWSGLQAFPIFKTDSIFMFNFNRLTVIELYEKHDLVGRNFRFKNKLDICNNFKLKKCTTN